MQGDSRRMDHPQGYGRQIWPTVLIKSVGGYRHKLWIHPVRYSHLSLFSIANGIVEWTVLLYVIEVSDSSFCLGTIHSCGLGSAVGIATDYGLGGLGIESQWG
jgi:hypothetical protein